MPRKDKVIHISNLPSTFRGNVTRNGRFIQNGISPLGGVYDKVVKSTGLIRLGNEFLYNGINNLVSKDNREKLMNNTAGRLINYVKDFNKESFPSDDELGPTFPFNIIQTPRSNGKNLPQKQYAAGGKIPNVVAGGIAQPLGNNFFYMNGRKHSQGGIDIGPSDKTGIEVEDGEVVETNGNELKVYSAQPIINGVSPAKLVMGGANPNKVFKAQEDFKDRNGINDDGTKAKYGKEKYVAKSDNTRVTPIMESPRNSGIKQGDFVNILDSNGKVIDIPDVLQTNIDDTRAFLKTFNKWNARYGYDPIPLSAAKNPKQADKLIKDRLLEHNTFVRGVHKTGNEENINNILRRNGIEPTAENRAKYYASTYAPDTGAGRAGFDSSYNGEGTIYSSNSLNTAIGYAKAKHRNEKDGFVVSVRRPIKFEGTRENWVKNADFAFDNSKQHNLYIDYELPYLLRYGKSARIELSKNKNIPLFNTRQHTGKYSKGYSRKSRKFGGKDMIVSISGNVKNGLIHSPSSTGGLRDKFAVGGKRINRHGRTWEYDEQIGAYVPITNRTINRTSAYPINKSARGETIIGSDYTFRNGRWSKNNNVNISTNKPKNNNGNTNTNKPKNNNVNTNTNKPNIDNGNRRPQYYAERRLPLFEDGAGITSGLVRAGWSHGNDKGISTNNTNIPSLSATKSSGKTPRRGRSKSSQSTQSVPTKTPPTAVYNRNLPKVEASIPTTLSVSTSTPNQGTKYSDSKGQGKFKNLTTADWIGLGSNVAGSLASYFASRRAINKMRGPGQPTLISANKLKTKYNINPQLDRIREDKFEAYRDIDSNTASSRVSLARKQRVRNTAGQAANELYGNKENIETNLINQDRRNQQSVRQFNAQQYNQYIDRKTAFDNGIREAKVTNINNLFSGINAGIQDMISRYENRKALNNTIGAMRASAPNVDDRIMRDAGVDYDEFIIRKRRKLGGKQSCR